jgi:anaerobic selenocysteine-containing dehydrogenase
MTILEKDGKLLFEPMAESWQQHGIVCSKMQMYAEREINNGIKPWQILDDVKSEFSNDSDALDAMAKLLTNNKDKKILYMRGSGSLGYKMGAWDQIFAQLEDCYNIDGNPCDTTGDTANEVDFTNAINPDATNMYNTDKIIVFGKNASNCSLNLYALLNDLKKQGKTIIYIDPINTKTAKLADRYIQINSGCDGMLACALLTHMGIENGHNVDSLIAESGITTDEFDYILRHIEPKKTSFIVGYGLQRQPNGMNSVQWLDRLAVKTDNTDTLYFGHGSKRFWKSMDCAPFKGAVNIADVASRLASGEFDLFVCIGANPAMTFPDSNLWAKALTATKTIVVDTNICKTADFADLFIKVGGMFSMGDTMGSYFFPHKHYRERYTNEMNDVEAAEALADRLGLTIDVREPKDMEQEVPTTREYVTKSLELLKPPTSQKFQFFTASHPSYLNSQILDRMVPELQVVHLNPKDAENYKLNNDDIVRVYNEYGQLKGRVLVSDMVPEKTLLSWKSIPMVEGQANNVIPAEATDAGNGLNYYTVFVDIDRG